MIKNIIIFPFFFILFGCASNGVADFRSIGINEKVVKEPLASNGYQGVLVEISSSSDKELNDRALEICRSRGGLKSYPSYTHTAPIGWKFYQYACNGLASVTPKHTLPVHSSPAVQKPIELQPAAPLFDVDEAKKKCADLGFTPNTEGFGKCVLRLTK